MPKSKPKGKGNVEAAKSGNSQGQGLIHLDGPHMMRDCPKKSKLGVLVADSLQDGDDSDVQMRINPMQLLGAIQGHEQVNSGLTYIEVLVNGVLVLAMVDTGATNNFVLDRMVKKLKLVLRENTTRMKAVNSEPMRVDEVAIWMLLLVRGMANAR